MAVQNAAARGVLWLLLLAIAGTSMGAPVLGRDGNGDGFLGLSLPARFRDKGKPSYEIIEYVSL